MAERVVTLQLPMAEKLLRALDDFEHRLRQGNPPEYDPSLGDMERAQQLEALRQDLELAIVRSPR